MEIRLKTRENRRVAQKERLRMKGRQTERGGRKSEREREREGGGGREIEGEREEEIGSEGSIVL